MAAQKRNTGDGRDDRGPRRWLTGSDTLESFRDYPADRSVEKLDWMHHR